MTTAEQNRQITVRALRQYMFLAIVYVILIFALPANQQTLHAYHITAVEYRILLFATALPSIAVWLAAFIGFAKLQQYAHFISKTPEGIHFDQLARGCTWLAWSLPLPTIISLVLNALADHWPNFHPTAIILTNYSDLFIPLVAFSIIAQASRGLLSGTKTKFNLVNGRFIVLGFVTIGVLYCFLTFRRFDLTSLGATNNPYFLPIWLMVVSITVPYLYAWFIGTLAAYEITLFSKQVPGVLYRQALRLLVGGLLAVVLSSIALQYLNSVEPVVGHLMLNYKLVLTTMVRIVGGAGFIMLAIGASRLKKIEEV
jgi:hypothetical protein